MLSVLLVTLIPLVAPRQLIPVNLPRNIPPCVSNSTSLGPPPSIQDCQITKLDSRLLRLSSDGHLYVRAAKVCLFEPYYASAFVELRCSGVSRRLEADLKLLHPVRADWSVIKPRAKRSAGGIHFDNSHYVVNVTEEGRADEPLLRVTATHDDRLPILYEMVAPEDTRSTDLLRLDRTTGQISSAVPLDRESMQRHVLRVSAYEKGNPTHSATATVIINVNDVQDHAPVFEQSTYTAEIAEDAQIGFTVLHVFARDEDAGPNGRVKYTLVQEDGSNVRDFQIVSDTGVIQVARRLDRETRDSYRFQVKATDQAKQPRVGVAVVTISVLDTNDHYPQFSEGIYRVSIPENVNIPSKVVRVEATDPDDGDNGRVRYSIVSGGDTFSIDYKTGDISLIRAINFKSSSVYELVIRAQDSGSPSHSNTTLVEVTIEDVNDNAPKFYSSQLQVSVRENVPPGFLVTRVQAFDSDTGANSRITYSMEIPKQLGRGWPFTIDEHSGWITTNKSLDREQHSQFDFQVLATDAGSPPLSSSVPISITVTDENDNQPIFEKKYYNVSIEETAGRGESVLQVQAFDPDEDANIAYSIMAGNENEMFLILSLADSAIITLNSQLDYKSRSVYTLTIKASDDGGKFDTATVYIYVLDINSAPYFTPHVYTVPVLESEPVGATVAVVKASDSDQGDNARLVYALSGADGHFSISPDTGVVRIAKALDREREQSFNLKIRAIDHGNPPLSTETELEVVLSDVNDNAPEFEKANYSVSISEDMPPRTSFFQVTAQDRDSGDNAHLWYEIDPDTNTNNTFKIDGSSGTIRTDRELDRESISHYHLTIYAIDSGTSKKTGQTTVSVDVLDVNDNPPRFEQQVYDLYIEENSPIGSVVGTLRAIDPDAGSNAKVTYRIFGGTDMGKFEIRVRNDTVTVLSRIELDYEDPERKNKQYRFQLQASSGDLSSVAEVIVHMVDQNDNTPILHDFFVVVANYEHRFPPNPLGRIPAYDPDLNSTLSYHMESNDLLLLDAESGFLSLNSHLNSTNRQLQAEFKTCVMDGANVVCAQCTLRYIQVTHEMLGNSVTLRIRGISRDEVLTPIVYSRLVDALSTLGPYDRRDVYLFSVQDEHLNQSIVNASFSIRQPKSDLFVSSEELREKVHLHRKALSQVANLEILPFEDKLCVREPCVNFEICQNTLKYGDAPQLITTQDFLFRPIDPISTFTCVCPAGFATSGRENEHQCDTEVNLCYSSPCRANGTCLQRENGYTCLCPPSRTGPHCEYPIVTEFCLPGLCKSRSYCDASSGQIDCKNCQFPPEFRTNFCELTTRSFDTDAYISLPTLKQRYRFQIELSIATIEPDGVIFYNGRYESSHDFIALRLNKGVPQFLFSLGDKQITTVALGRYDTNRLDDGKWHKITVEFLNRTVTLSVDDCDTNLALRFADDIAYKHCAVTVTKRLSERCVSCHRFLDLTAPFYLAGLPSKANVRLSQTEGFKGCVKELKIDQSIIDLSKSISDHKSQEGCPSLRDTCGDFSCNRCMNIWNGFKCDCGDNRAEQNCSKIVEEANSFDGKGSFLTWQLLNSQPIPLTLGLSIRTRQRNAQMLLAEFNTKDFLKFTLTNGLPTVVLNSGHYILPFPAISDGQWHTMQATINENHLNITVDYVNTKRFYVNHDTFYSSIIELSTGSSIKSKHSKGFLGCAKGAFLGANFLKRGYYHDVVFGCDQADSCETNPCPPHSTCLQDWDSYKCKCLPGYAGKDCVSICSLPSICYNGGTCQHASNPAGYRCACPSGFTGKYCQTALPPSGLMCPTGWWGTPLCGPCTCDTGNGFSYNCDKLNGQCSCKKNHYRLPQATVCNACKCYSLGSHNDTCNPVTGQCHCKGNIIGLRCNSCPLVKHQINGTSGQCELITRKCPATRAAGIDWPVTELGVLSVRSCDSQLQSGAEGLATRRCGHNGQWNTPKMSNCTSKPFIALQRNLSSLKEKSMTGGQALKLAEELNNAAMDKPRLFENDVRIAYRLTMALLRFEVNKTGRELVTLTHVQDKGFVKNLITVSDELLDKENLEFWEETPNATMHLLHHYDLYGKTLAAVHQRSFLRPFHVNKPNMVYSVDHLEAGHQITLPKYNNFLYTPTWGSSFYPTVTLHADKEERTAFYGIYPTAHSLISDKNCSQCINAALISMAVVDRHGQSVSSLHSPIAISFPLINTINRSHPECVWWAVDRWTTEGCKVAKENDSHVTCECTHLSTFTVRMRNTHGAFRYKSDRILTYMRPISSGFSLLLLLISFLLLCCVNQSTNSNRRYTHQAIIITLALHLIALFFVQHAARMPTTCSAVFVILHFTSMALIAWLFLYILQWYRSVTDMRSTNQNGFWLCALIGWQVPLIIAVATVFLSQPDSKVFCWFALKDPYIWTMAVPVALMLLLCIYVSVMCFLITLNREWDILLAKLKLRSTLWHYMLVLIGSVAYIVFAWLSLNLQIMWLHYTTNILLILLSCVIFIWVVYLEQKSQFDVGKPNLWMEGASKVNGSATIQNIPRAESPCLSDEMAPQEEEPFISQQQNPLLPEQRNSPPPTGVDNRRIVSPRRPNDNTARLDDSLQPLMQTADITPSYQKFFTKPDLIPSWEEQLNMASAPTSIVQSPSTPSYSTLSYSSSSPRSIIPRGTPILSPVQKVLFDNNDRHLHTFSPNRAARLETFGTGSASFGTMPRTVPVNCSPIRMIDEAKLRGAETSL